MHLLPRPPPPSRMHWAGVGGGGGLSHVKINIYKLSPGSELSSSSSSPPGEALELFINIIRLIKIMTTHQDVCRRVHPIHC